MRILMINTLYAIGSTGKIVKQISDRAFIQGHQCLIAHRYEISKVNYLDNCISISSWLDCHMHNRISRLTMLRGCFSHLKTLVFLKKIQKFNPELIHLHNIHGNYINLKMLFRYIKRNNIKVIWTFHDCWPLTGNCKYFDMVNCNEWLHGCRRCRQKGNAIIDIASIMHKQKKKMFSNIENMTIVVPSVWLADLVRKSMLCDYPVRVINNGIDLSVFRPTESEFKEKNGLTDKKIILGVAFEWGKRKGLDIFIRLAEQLPREYQIVLVGTNPSLDLTLPNNILTIHQTNDQTELAAIYTAADVFVNPTREDNYPTVNMEALACGTPVVTFRTGGSPEMIDNTCGCVVEKEDVGGLVRTIRHIVESKMYTKEACLNKAKSFDMNDRFEEYIQLYNELADN